MGNFREAVVAKMIQTPEVKWWFDEDTELWHAQHVPSGLSRVESTRDGALVALNDSLLRGGDLERVRRALESTGSVCVDGE